MIRSFGPVRKFSSVENSSARQPGTGSLDSKWTPGACKCFPASYGRRRRCYAGYRLERAVASSRPTRWLFKDYSDDSRVYPDEFDDQVLYPLLDLKAHLK